MGEIFPEVFKQKVEAVSGDKESVEDGRSHRKIKSKQYLSMERVAEST